MLYRVGHENSVHTVLVDLSMRDGKMGTYSTDYLGVIGQMCLALFAAIYQVAVEIRVPLEAHPALRSGRMC